MAKRQTRGKKYFTAKEANATLPLIRSITQDITDLARDLRDRYERLAKAKAGAMSDAYQEELKPIRVEFERDQERLEEYESELKKLGVELKDYDNGLIDFPCWMDNREVYLCWRLGEPEVCFWHEVDAGFAGRREINPAPAQAATPEKA